jgi:hypothetical protein
LGAVLKAGAAVPSSPRTARGGWRPQHPALPGVSWLGSQPCGVRAAAHQPASWHQARDDSQPGERKQLGWQPAHSARAVSRETGQAGLRPPAPKWDPGQATRTEPSSSSSPELQGGPVDASPKQGSGI